jgi:hypothetical protein
MRRSLVLVAAVALALVGALSARAVSPASGRPVGGRFVATSSGVYRLGQLGWQPFAGPPISPDQVAQVSDDGGVVIDTDGNGWRNLDAAGWQNSGPAPGSATPALRATWGEVKSRYR